MLNVLNSFGIGIVISTIILFIYMATNSANKEEMTPEEVYNAVKVCESYGLKAVSSTNYYNKGVIKISCHPKK